MQQILGPIQVFPLVVAMFIAIVFRVVARASQEETRITQVADPWGGSYMMESLTEDMVQGAKEIIDEVGRTVCVPLLFLSGRYMRPCVFDS